MWVLLTLLTAVCTAVRDAASKQAARSVPAVVVAFWIASIPALVLSIIAVMAPAGGSGPSGLVETISDTGFLTALAVSGGINAVATPLVVWARLLGAAVMLAGFVLVTFA